MKMTVKIVLGVLAAAAASAHGYEFRARWVERVGNVDSVIGAELNATDGRPRRVRLQLGVFDDGTGPAPAGGFVGWNLGMLTVSGDVANSNDTRTPGRLSPFIFSGSPGANGNPPAPEGDPFTTLTDIDAQIGMQMPFWGIGQPQPAPLARGVNTWVSVYEITTDPRAVGLNYTITASGNLVAATSWEVVGAPTPPDPDKMLPGSVTYVPVETPPRAFQFGFIVHIEPAPGSVALLCVGGLFAARRRR